MHYQVCDSEGRVALIPIVDCMWDQRRLGYHSSGLRIYETGEVIKQLDPQFSWTSHYQAPRARVLRGYLKYAPFGRTKEPLVFNIGYVADNGFSVPSARVVDELYVREQAVKSDWLSLSLSEELTI